MYKQPFVFDNHVKTKMYSSYKYNVVYMTVHDCTIFAFSQECTIANKNSRIVSSLIVDLLFARTRSASAKIIDSDLACVRRYAVLFCILSPTNSSTGPQLPYWLYSSTGYTALTAVGEGIPTKCEASCFVDIQLVFCYEPVLVNGPKLCQEHILAGVTTRFASRSVQPGVGR